MTHADYHPCSEGCGRDSELPGPCEECDMRRRLAAAAVDHAAAMAPALVVLENAPGKVGEHIAAGLEAAGYKTARPQTMNRLHVATVTISFEFAYLGSETTAREHIDAALRDLGKDAALIADVQARPAAPDYEPSENGDPTDRVFGAYCPRTGNPLNWAQAVADETGP